MPTATLPIYDFQSCGFGTGHWCLPLDKVTWNIKATTIKRAILHMKIEGWSVWAWGDPSLEVFLIKGQQKKSLGKITGWNKEETFDVTDEVQGLSKLIFEGEECQPTCWVYWTRRFTAELIVDYEVGGEFIGEGKGGTYTFNTGLSPDLVQLIGLGFTFMMSVSMMGMMTTMLEVLGEM